MLEPRAHPRSRGENPRTAASAGYCAGSSPLTRGKLRLATHAQVPPGLIPAHAGKTSRSCSRAARRGAHPRSRGENSAPATATRRPSGSSPLTRGKPFTDSGTAAPEGLIPAHAGKTGSIILQARRVEAHPRSRGENVYQVRKSVGVRGSSPLTRGKHRFCFCDSGEQGLIPAHAGKTALRARPPRGFRAHPRSRGENVATERRVRDARGSSPLTRGKRAARSSSRSRRGLIPAHTGKTFLPPGDCWRVGAHPRSRGENFQHHAPICRDEGSSPLTRGKLSGRCLGRFGPGLIPAHAGKTINEPRFKYSVRAHPRSRGENNFLGSIFRAHPGSSPLTRGKPVMGFG